MPVDILIDDLTDCLIDRNNGRPCATEYKMRTSPIKPREYHGWKFDWKKTEKNGYHIYELFLANDNVVQGRISLKISGGVAEVEIAETAPHNYGHLGKYQGVGAHLFAIACKVSLDNGCDGVVAFTAKSSLVAHYKNALGAVEIAPRRMVIFEDAAKELLEKYIKQSR